MTAEAIERLFPAGIMERIRREWPRERYLLHHHRLVAGETPCPSCGAVLEDTHKGCCATCERPWDQRCPGYYANGAKQSCDTFTTAARARAGYWAPPPGMCGQCDRKQGAEQRRENLEADFPQLRTLLPLARTYRAYGHRQKLDAAIARDDWRALLIWGPCGSGKSVTVARWAVQRYLQNGSMMWVSGHELVRAFKWTDGQASHDLVSSAHRVRTLVIEDWQASGCVNWTPNVAAEMSHLLQQRLDADMRTVITTNRAPEEALKPPGMGGPISEHVLSRWRQHGLAVECASPDMRGGHVSQG